MKRILIIGGTAPWSLEALYLKALVQAGVPTVECFDTGKHQIVFSRSLPGRVASRLVAPWNTYQLNAGLIRFLHSRPSSFDAIIVFKGFDLTRDTFERCRRLTGSARWVNINPDNPFDHTLSASTNPNILASITFFDLYCTWSRALVATLKEQGARAVHYLPFGYDPEMHRSLGPTKPISNRRVLFVGTWDPWRERQLSELAEFDLTIYGHDWERVSRSSPLYAKLRRRPLYREELASETASSAVSLNLLRQQNAGAHNMRTFEIPALGGLMLTTRSDEQQEFFPEGEASFMFENTPELKDQIRRIFSDPEKANSIRWEGQRRVLRHSYSQRAAELLAALNGVSRG
jgi:spore maturation protein CgeB